MIQIHLFYLTFAGLYSLVCIVAEAATRGNINLLKIKSGFGKKQDRHIKNRFLLVAVSLLI